MRDKVGVLFSITAIVNQILKVLEFSGTDMLKSCFGFLKMW